MRDTGGLLAERNGDFARLGDPLRERDAVLDRAAGDERRPADLLRRTGDLDRRTGDRVDRVFGDFARRNGETEDRCRAELENLSVRERDEPRRTSDDNERRSGRRLGVDDLREVRTGPIGEVGAEGEYMALRFFGAELVLLQSLLSRLLSK